MKISPTILIDTREQLPLTFRNLPSEPATLTTGDYSIRGLEHLITIERKGLEDLLACTGRDRERFERELHRMQSYRFRHLVIEASAETLECGNWKSQVAPFAVCGSLAAWAARYDVHAWLCGNHDACGRWTERLLYQAARQVAKECEAVAGFVADAMKSTQRRTRTAALLPATAKAEVTT